MWIQECLKLYEETVEHISGKRADPGRLEDALAGAKAKKQVGPGELEIIEKGDYWPYPEWWPKLSEQFGRPIAFPERLDSREEKKKAISRLQERVKHIEVVSIILRFIFPKEFGIISPPVIGLLNLVPVPDKDYAGQYLRYLHALEELRQHYRPQLGFGRIADFDMALWTAAHLQLTKHKAILDKMYQDDDFQEIRLRNLLKGLEKRWKRTLRERLILARALLRHDPAAAAVTVAHCYEKIIWEVGDKVGCEIHIRKSSDPSDPSFRERLKFLAKYKEVRDRSVSLNELDLWQLRNEAVHGEKNRETGESEEISEARAKEFLEGVEKLNECLGGMLP